MSKYGNYFLTSPKRQLVLIDNFDSFTYNIVQAFQAFQVDVHVIRNHRHVEDVLNIKPDYLVIGPGPGHPQGAGISRACIEIDLPILGICLGHQVIGEVLGGKVVHANQVMHGKVSRIYHNGSGIFKGLPQGFSATRYHSLILEPPPSVEVTAWTKEGEVMGICHGKLEGVQFHPESIATPDGLLILENYLMKNTKS